MKLLPLYLFIEMSLVNVSNLFGKVDFLLRKVRHQRMAVRGHAARVVNVRPFSDTCAGRRKVGKELRKPVEFRRKGVLFAGSVMALNTIDIAMFRLLPRRVVSPHDVARTAKTGT